jgi:hypothetical protein
VNTYRYKTTMHNRQCTYLNIGLLVAPREDVLHGFVPGIDWTLFWQSLWECVLLPHPTRCLTVYDDGSSFTPTSSAIWVASHLCTSKHHNRVIWYKAHTYIHQLALLFIFFFFTPLPLSWAGWLSSIPFVRYSYDRLKFIIESHLRTDTENAWNTNVTVLTAEHKGNQSYCNNPAPVLQLWCLRHAATPAVATVLTLSLFSTAWGLFLLLCGLKSERSRPLLQQQY